MIKTISLVCLKAGSEPRGPMQQHTLLLLLCSPASPLLLWQVTGSISPNPIWLPAVDNTGLCFIYCEVNVSDVEDIKLSSNTAQPQGLHSGVLCPPLHH